MTQWIRTAGVALIGAALSLPALAGRWVVPRTLEGPFAVSSPPEAPLLAMNASGDALLAWNATGRVRYADKPSTGRWSRSITVPDGGTGAGPVAVALGGSGAAAVAWTTVATRYVPSQLRVSWRGPAGNFGPSTEVAPGTGVWTLKLGLACDGSVTLLWQDAQGVRTSTLAGVPGTGTCSGSPGAGPWTAPQPLSDTQVGAALPDLAVNDAGAAVATWQQGATAVAVLRPAGGDWGAAQVVSMPTASAVWNARPVIDAQGRPAVGYLDGDRMWVVRGDAAGTWGDPILVSGTQRVAYPALAATASGELLAAWQALDASNQGAAWQAVGTADGNWSAPARLSAPAEDAAWPSVAMAADGSVAFVAWIDQSTNTARAAVRQSGTWTRSTLGAGWWGGTVPVAAGGGLGMAGWAVPAPGNPNSATLVARPWR